MSHIHLHCSDFVVLQVATRQIKDADIRARIRDTTQATKAVDLARDLHYILINICQGAAATVPVVVPGRSLGL